MLDIDRKVAQSLARYVSKLMSCECKCSNSPWPGSLQRIRPTQIFSIGSVAEIEGRLLLTPHMMQSLKGASVQSSLPCHQRTCRSQTTGRAHPHSLTPGHQLDQQRKGRSKPFVPAKSAKGEVSLPDQSKPQSSPSFRPAARDLLKPLPASGRKQGRRCHFRAQAAAEGTPVPKDSMLVVGSTGTLGRQVVRKALDAGYDVRCTVRPRQTPADFLRDWGATTVQVHLHF